MNRPTGGVQGAGTVEAMATETTDHSPGVPASTAVEVFGPERVAQLRALLDAGTLDLAELSAEDQACVVETLEGLWGALVRERSSFEPLLGDVYGPVDRHWHRPARRSGPPRFRHDEAYAEMSDAEVAVLTRAGELRGTLPSSPEPADVADGG